MILNSNQPGREEKSKQQNVRDRTDRTHGGDEQRKSFDSMTSSLLFRGQTEPNRT